MATDFTAPTVVQCPTESEPWGSYRQIMSGSKILVVQEWYTMAGLIVVTKEHTLDLPEGVKFLSMEEVGLILFGTFFDEAGRKISSFSIDGVGNITNLE